MISGGSSRTVTTYHARDIDSIERCERADGTGDVTFAHQYRTDSRGNRTTTSIGFYGIHQPQEVEKLIRKLVDDRGPNDKPTDSLTPLSTN